MPNCRIHVDDIIDFSPDATLAVDSDRRVIIWNRAIERMTGISANIMLGQGDYAYTIPFHGEARPLLIDLLFIDEKELPAQYNGVVRIDGALTGEVFCKSLNNGNGAWVFVKAAPLHDDYGKIIGAIEIIRDITAQKQSELYNDISRKILVMLNEPCSLKVNLKRIITIFKDKTEFDAVGIRMQNGEDYPYFCSVGLSYDFLVKEQSILEHSVDGSVCHDEYGNACLECTCGMVITGKIPSGHPLFTSGGSFWSNDTSLLLDLSTDRDPRNNPRNGEHSLFVAVK